MRVLATLGIAVVTISASAQDHSCTPVKAAAAGAQTAANAMAHDISSASAGDISYDITPTEATADQHLKDALAALARAEMNCLPVSDFPDGGLVAEDLGFVVMNKTGPGTVPDNIQFQVKTQPGPHPLVGILSSFHIACGDDSLLMVFSRQGNGWRETLRLSGKLGKDVSSGWGSAKFGLSPPDAAGHWFVVLLFNRDWCTSCWSGGLNYIVARPGSAPSTPRVLTSESAGLYRCAGSPYDLQVQANEFEVHYEDAGLGMDPFTIRALLHFRVTGSRVVRLLPTAQTPVEAVVWWINAAWRKAKIMTAGDPVSLKQAHDALEAAQLDPNSHLDLTAAQCNDGRTVRVGFEADAANEVAPRPYFIHLRQPDLAITAASRAPDPACHKPSH